MIEATRAKLIAAARQAFAQHGYAQASMDELTAQVGLTRGALYHHFGGKSGLLAAVVAQMDAEMDERLDVVLRAHTDPWLGFLAYCRAYLAMAQEAEIRRIVLQDARSVLTGTDQGQQHQQCIAYTTGFLLQLMDQGVIVPASAPALARLLNGCLVEAAFWIAEENAPPERLEQALQALDLMLQGWKA
ncbi:MAG: TetR/AcrR family transcriptional regulator [Comamonas sp.]|uniref:TetR/AcrR family transcriptional regulator n=1 Tax=Comamonas sp. TaxID=34028 RepID=UPI002828E160|nr:helix-turn-helix domain-containing protein [Comamonas sp.]MDR0213760.1 TetR/AcrR family transcriptional regulator [Comamonas sp.]MDR2298701.1 TetR/AcrR family transcriptional regulator [Comamonas sp.]